MYGWERHVLLRQLKAYVRQVRPVPPPEPLIRVETAPGHQGQVDFAEVRLPWGKRYALLVVLGYSRLLWFQCYPQQTMAILMRGLEAAFAFFGGVPTELRFDQLKAVILHDHRPHGGRVLENPTSARALLPTCARQGRARRLQCSSTGIERGKSSGATGSRRLRTCRGGTEARGLRGAAS